MKYMLISVCEREITTHLYDTLEDARTAMISDLESCIDLEDDEYEIEEMSAWANADDGDMNCDWQIVEIE